MKICITGTGGFIGYHLAKKMLERGDSVIGIDNINSYYDVNLKYSRLENSGVSTDSIEYNKLIQSNKYNGYQFIQLNLEDKNNLEKVFKENKVDAVCNLAAQAGVRYSLKNPDVYISSNITGFLNVLESVRSRGIKNLTYASSSSVYGLNETKPFSVSHNVDHPVSLYAASKKANELMAHSYSHLYNIPTTGFRFFTVYGPWGRPDMALFKFVKNILQNKPIDVYNHGNMKRDFTYIDDIVEGIVKVIDKPAVGNNAWSGTSPDPASSCAPYRIYNIGNGKPVGLMDFISCIEKKLGKKAKCNKLPMQPGDVPETFADTEALQRDYGYSPATGIEYGIENFVSWYRDYFDV